MKLSPVSGNHEDAGVDIQTATTDEKASWERNPFIRVICYNVASAAFGAVSGAVGASIASAVEYDYDAKAGAQNGAIGFPIITSTLLLTMALLEKLCNPCVDFCRKLRVPEIVGVLAPMFFGGGIGYAITTGSDVDPRDALNVAEITLGGGVAVLLVALSAAGLKDIAVRSGIGLFCQKRRGSGQNYLLMRTDNSTTREGQPAL